MQRNIDWVCGLGLDCEPIREGGACFEPDTVPAHAAFAMNAYFQASGGNDFDCDFRETGNVTTVDPSGFGILVQIFVFDNVETFITQMR